jgi:hypothetical protein
MLADVPANHVELLLLRNKRKVDVSHGIRLVIGVVNRSSRMSCPLPAFSVIASAIEVAPRKYSWAAMPD